MARKAKKIEEAVPAPNMVVVPHASENLADEQAAKEEIASTEALVLEPANAAVETDKTSVDEPAKEGEKEVLTLRFGIDQRGIDIDGALSEKQFFELKIVQDPKKPLDIVKIAGNFGRNMWSVIRHLSHKSKKAGFNLTFYIDNNLSADYSVKAGGTLKFDSPVNISFGILGIIAAQFDETNAESFLTGTVHQSQEINLMTSRLGFNEKAKDLPFEYLEPIFEAKRKAVKAEFQTKRKEMLKAVN